LLDDRTAVSVPVATNRVTTISLNRWLCLEREAVPPKTKFQEVRLPNPASRWPVEVVSPQGWANDKAGASQPAQQNLP
jgi:hypothetical protein